VAWRLVVIVCGFGQIDLTHICSAESMEPMFGLVFSCILDSSSKCLDAPCFLKQTSVGFGCLGHVSLRLVMLCIWKHSLIKICTGRVK
jgi:hypothetical protein